MTVPATFFPPGDQRDVQQHVIESYPYPIAAAYARLHEEMDRQQAVAAAWQLRDCWEVTIRFCATVALADAFAHPVSPDPVPELAKRLLKWNGLSISDWHNLTMESIAPLKPHIKANTLSTSGRMVPELANVFQASHIKLSKVALSIQGHGDSFVSWRNRVFGHGVFKNDEQWYAEQTMEKLDGLHLFLDALQPIFEKWSLVGEDADGNIATWWGVGESRPGVRHRHEIEGDPLPLRLESGTESLSLLPFLTIQKCTVCGQHSGFFFDRLKDKTKTMLLEYDDGHEAKRTHWQPITDITAKLPPQYTFERSAYDKDDLEQIDVIVFRDLEQEYLRPDYLLDSIWEHIDEADGGYLLVTGPEGVGKSYLIHGVAEDAPEFDAVVIPYFIRQGASAVAQTFGNEVHLKASSLQMRTIGPQFKGASREEVRQDFTDYLRTVSEENGHIGTIILAIDALDELADVEPTQIGIIDMLPNPDELPDNVFILITRRDQLRPEVRTALPRIEDSAWKAELDPSSTDNHDVVGAYVRKQLDTISKGADEVVPVQQQPAWVRAIVEKSGGVMLYASHLVKALEGGVFTDVSTLPSGDEFYEAYLGRIRARVGDQLYNTVYRKALLYLSAAFAAVTFEQLVGWGIPRDRLMLAMYDLRDFIRYTRVPGFHDSLGDAPEPRYALAHESFRRFANRTVPEELQAVHRHMAVVAVNRFGAEWDDIDPADDRDLYALLYLRDHVTASGGDIDLIAEVDTESLANRLFELAEKAHESRRYVIADKGFREAIGIRENLVAAGQTELQSDVAAAQAGRAKALGAQGDLPAALAGFDEAINIIRKLLGEGSSEVRHDLAGALMHRSNTLRQQGNLPDAITDSGEAVDIWQTLTDDGDIAVQYDLAAAHMNHGNALYVNGNLDGAISAYDEAIIIRRSMISAGNRDLQDDLALALMNRANALGDLGRTSDAITGFDEAIRIRRNLIEHGLKELENELAMVLMNRANILARSGDFAGALQGYDESVDIRRTLIAAGRNELNVELALALMNRAQALADMGDLPGAIAGFNDSIAIWRGLIEAGRTDLHTDLALSLMNRSNALAEQGDVAGALPGFVESVTIMRELVAVGRSELRVYLATNLLMQSKTMADYGDANGAHAGYEEGIELFRTLVTEGWVHLQPALATGILYHASTLESLGDLPGAIAGYAEAIDIWSYLDPLSPASVPYLTEAISARARAHRQLGAIPEAFSTLEAGMSALTALPEPHTSRMFWVAQLMDCKAELMESIGEAQAAIDLRREIGAMLKHEPTELIDNNALRDHNSEQLARLQPHEKVEDHG